MIRRQHVFGALIGAAVVLAGFYFGGADLTHRGYSAGIAYVFAILGKFVGVLGAKLWLEAKAAAEQASPGIVAEASSLPGDLKAVMDRVTQIEERIVTRQPLDVTALTGAVQAIGDMAKKIQDLEARMSEVSLVAGLRRPANPLGPPDTPRPTV